MKKLQNGNLVGCKKIKVCYMNHEESKPFPGGWSRFLAGMVIEYLRGDLCL
jgi:hypothetical protein